MKPARMVVCGMLGGNECSVGISRVGWGRHLVSARVKGELGTAGWTPGPTRMWMICACVRRFAVASWDLGRVGHLGRVRGTQAKHY